MSIMIHINKNVIQIHNPDVPTCVFHISHSMGLLEHAGTVDGQDAASETKKKRKKNKK